MESHSEIPSPSHSNPASPEKPVPERSRFLRTLGFVSDRSVEDESIDDSFADPMESADRSVMPKWDDAGTGERSQEKDLPPSINEAMALSSSVESTIPGQRVITPAETETERKAAFESERSTGLRAVGGELPFDDFSEACYEWDEEGICDPDGLALLADPGSYSGEAGCSQEEGEAVMTVSPLDPTPWVDEPIQNYDEAVDQEQPAELPIVEPVSENDYSSDSPSADLEPKIPVSSEDGEDWREISGNDSDLAAEELAAGVEREESETAATEGPETDEGAPETCEVADPMLETDADPVLSEPDESDTAAARPSNDADDLPVIFDVQCPQCEKALSLRNEHVGIEGQCVWCETPIVAAASGLDGKVRVFRVAKPEIQFQTPEPEPALPGVPESFPPPARTEINGLWDSEPRPTEEIPNESPIDDAAPVALPESAPSWLLGNEPSEDLRSKESGPSEISEEEPAPELAWPEISQPDDEAVEPISEETPVESKDKESDRKLDLEDDQPVSPVLAETTSPWAEAETGDPDSLSSAAAWPDDSGESRPGNDEPEFAAEAPAFPGSILEDLESENDVARSEDSTNGPDDVPAFPEVSPSEPVADTMESTSGVWKFPAAPSEPSAFPRKILMDSGKLPAAGDLPEPPTGESEPVFPVETPGLSNEWASSGPIPEEIPVRGRSNGKTTALLIVLIGLIFGAGAASFFLPDLINGAQERFERYSVRSLFEESENTGVEPAEIPSGKASSRAAATTGPVMEPRKSDEDKIKNSLPNLGANE